MGRLGSSSAAHGDRNHSLFVKSSEVISDRFVRGSVRGLRRARRPVVSAKPHRPERWSASAIESLCVYICYKL